MIDIMRRVLSIAVLGAVVVAGVLHAPGVARADDGPQPPPPPMGSTQSYPAQQQGQPYPAPGQAPGQGPVYGPPVYDSPRVYAPAPYPPIVTGPEEITSFDPNAPAPYGYTKVTRHKKGLIVGGAVTFGVSWGISTLVAAIGEDDNNFDGTNRNRYRSMWIPVLGPFLQMREGEKDAQFLLLHLGLAQTAGAIMLIAGISSTKTVLLRNDQVSIVPMVTHDASGMMVSGRF